MLSQKVKEYLKNQGWWFDEASVDYKSALSKLGIDPSSDIYEFYIHAEDGPTFYSRQKEIYQIGWFILNSDYDLDLKRTHITLGLKNEYIPLDSFEGEYGFFYNKKTGEVADLSLGKNLYDLKSENIHPQWKDFNAFLEWFFEL